ncbi:hypothetical protein ACHQM5_026481 [Ranunculus cassubicifolius]
MFGFSRRRMKLGRLKVHLSDSSQGTRSPIRHAKKFSKSLGEEIAPASSNSDELNCEDSPADAELNNCTAGNSESWMVLSTAGDKPAPRFNHSATVIGDKMVVVGGESGQGLLDDVQVLNFEKFKWTTASSKLYLSPTSLPLKLPACKGHCLVSWGKKALLIGGKTDPISDKISVWAFDAETGCWSVLEAKGDIPVARSGHTVVRAGSVLFLFGGEDAKRRKLNDLHMFDLKSLIWLSIRCTGTRPSPRSNHVAALHDDRILYIFGGTSKSRTLNDLYSLDFETMIWSRIKIKGFHPSPRAGCCGVLCGYKWYIAGGGSRKKRHTETLVFDVLKVEWSVVVSSPPSSITTHKGFTLVLVQHKEKVFLVAFGGCKKEPSNQVEVLIMEKNEHSMSRRSTLDKGPFPSPFESRSSALDSVARHNLASVLDHHGSSRRSISESCLVDSHPAPGNVSLRKQFSNEVKNGSSNFEEASPLFENESSKGHHKQLSGNFSDKDITTPENDGSLNQLYETKLSALMRKNGILEGQLTTALSSKESAEKSLSSMSKSKQDLEKKLTDSVKEMELLKEKVAGLEVAQEESNNLSNIVHSDNVRLEHDVAFLKAVLEDTQKELRSTRGVLAGERARAFQLQVEVFHLKQRLQSMENRASTPRKPYHM